MFTDTTTIFSLDFYLFELDSVEVVPLRPDTTDFSQGLDEL
ncbi:hypothetical protein QET40_02250 [Akkermansia sp. N21169]|nr:hypothetical protein [Akkermansia sp. N21169]MDH3067923.1 hypothetical protein [Akkermansia sp. N21169]